MGGTRVEVETVEKGKEDWEMEERAVAVPAPGGRM